MAHRPMWVLVLLLLTCSCVSRAIAPLSKQRHSLAAAGGSGLIIFAGGLSSFTNAGLATVDIYNTTTEGWVSSPGALSTPRFNLVGVYGEVETERLFFFAGGASTSEFFPTVDIYNDSSGDWSIANLSFARSQLAAASNKEFVAFAGGYNNMRVSDAFDVYNLKTQDWTSLSGFSPARALHAAGSVGDYIIFAGGMNADSSVAFANVSIFDAARGVCCNNSMQLSVARWLLVAASVGDYVVFAGGMSPLNSPLNTVDIFNVATLYGQQVPSLKLVIYSRLTSSIQF